jgi:hypothetical protein
VTAGYYDLYIEKGTTFRRVFNLSNDDDSVVDLTGYSARLQVREKATDDDPLATWTPQLTIDEEAGEITLLLTDVQTAALEFNKGVYDLEIESAGGETSRLLEGAVTCSDEVTR